MKDQEKATTLKICSICGDIFPTEGDETTCPLCIPPVNQLRQSRGLHLTDSGLAGLPMLVVAKFSVWL
jgi:Zn finger protein HypA/HybF involved in hydrogenase expression